MRLARLAPLVGLALTTAGCATFVISITGVPSARQKLTWDHGTPILRAATPACEITIYPVLTTGTQFPMGDASPFILRVTNVSQEDVELSEASIKPLVNKIPVRIASARELETKYRSIVVSTGRVVTTSSAKDKEDGSTAGRSVSQAEGIGPLRRTTLPPGGALKAYFIVENNRPTLCNVPDARGKGHGGSPGPCAYSMAVACGADREVFSFVEDAQGK